MSASKLSPKKQREIFRFAQERELELVEALARFDHQFDDLVYDTTETKRWNGTQPKSLAELQREPNTIPVVSFFAGCGGIDLGFETAGFQHIAAFEINELFCKTLRRNRPDWAIYGPPRHSGDLSDFEETHACLSNLIPSNFEGVFIGGPPCQPFSVAASQRYTKTGGKYKRLGFKQRDNGCLLLDYLKLIEYFNPRCFVIENVRGLRDIDHGEQLGALLGRLREIGYEVEEPRLLNAAHYGVPQLRERLFVIGTRSSKPFIFPSPCVDKMIGSGSVLPRNRDKTPNHETRTHQLNSVIRYAKLHYGQRDQLGRINRLDPCQPSKTVIAGGSSGGGRSHLHPEIPRTLSVRECARLQTFPDDYIFVGPTARQFTQVGNAVPPVLATQIAIAIADTVFGT